MLFAIDEVGRVVTRPPKAVTGRVLASLRNWAAAQRPQGGQQACCAPLGNGAGVRPYPVPGPGR